ncbi:hypothetical protein [Halalkalibacter oceani]|uniref:hypothetical protein n=1 Tax=Halalkalibacter oceani TaxID=1653776 RepID=UPI003393155F
MKLLKMANELNEQISNLESQLSDIMWELNGKEFDYKGIEVTIIDIDLGNKKMLIEPVNNSRISHWVSFKHLF